MYANFREQKSPNVAKKQAMATMQGMAEHWFSNVYNYQHCFLL